MSLITCKKLKGGGKTLRYIFYMLVIFCFVTKVSAEDVVDLEGATLAKNASAFKKDYSGKTIKNGVVNISSVADNDNLKDGVFTIGNGATVNSNGSSAEFRPNNNCIFNINDGGTLSTDVVLCIPFRYGNQSFIMDGGTFTSSATQTYTGGYSVNIGYVWNNKTVWADNSAKLIMNNGSVFNVTKGTLSFGKSKSHEKKVNLQVDVAVTNSSIVVSKGQIVLCNNDNAWLTDKAKSYVKVVFGPGSQITTGQIYADGVYPAPSVIFDGATIHWTGNNASFIGHRNTAGDIYTIDSLGLTIDIPSGKSLTCDHNSSSLKGEGGITKIGEGSIVWNQVSANGSQGMTFTGPLVVSNGTWTSTLGYASSAFKVDGKNSQLLLSGVLSAKDIELFATDGGVLRITGATIPNDAAPDAFILDGGVFEDVQSNFENARRFGTLGLGKSSVVKVGSSLFGVIGMLAEELNVSATEESPVLIQFSSPEDIPVGTYAVLSIVGDGVFAEGDQKKFALDQDAPTNATLSISDDKKSLLFTVPATNPATWTGSAGDGKFSTASNWLGGIVPNAEAEIDIKASSDIELVCDIAIAVKSITIHPQSAKVAIKGAGSILLSEKIINVSEYAMDVNVPVEFKSGEDYGAIDVIGVVDFQGGVKGTVPVNHTTFYGNYTLTATKWTLSDVITLAEGAAVTANDLVITTSKTRQLYAQAGSTFKFNTLMLGCDGEIFGDYAGVINVKALDFQREQLVCNIGSGFSGTLMTDKIFYFCNNATKNFDINPAEGAKIVLGSEGITAKRGYVRFPNKITVNSSGDWFFKIINHNYAQDNKGVDVAAELCVDTSDFEKQGSGHTVTVIDDSTQSDKVLFGNGVVKAIGDGTFKFQNSGLFTGGFVASDNVTVEIKKGVSPGKGNVTIKDTATIKLTDSASGTVPIVGKLTLEGGATLHVPNFSGTVVPMSVASLEFANVEEDKKIALKIDGGTLVNGNNTIIQSANGLPENAWEMFDITLGAALPEGAELLYVIQNNALCIVVKGLNDCVWTGKGKSSAFSDGANWINGTAPSNGANLHILVPSDTTLLNDIENFSPASITFSTGSGSVTIDGDNAIKGVVAVTNLSSSSHTINVPVYFKESIAVVQNARGYSTRDLSHVAFAGGAYAQDGYSIASWDDGYSWAVFGNYYYANDVKSPYTIKEYKRAETDDIRFVVGDNSSLYIPYAGDLRELEICSGSTVNIGEMSLTEKNDRVSHKNLGEMVVTNLYISGSGDMVLTYDQSGDVSSVYKFMSVTNDLKASWFYFSDGHKVTRHTVFIGEYGLNFTVSATGSYCIGRDASGNVETIRPWYSDFTVSDNGNHNVSLVFNRDVIFCTDDENGIGRKITIDAITRGNKSPAITVSGSGILQVNKLANNAAQPTVSVVDTATLSYISGASLGTGSIAVNQGATLAAKGAGAVDLSANNVTLNNGVVLGFEFDKFANTSIAPQFMFGTDNLSFTDSEQTNVVVKITGKYPCASTFTLTSGYDFRNVTSVVSAEHNPQWVKGIFLDNNGNIVLQVKPRGSRVILR